MLASVVTFGKHNMDVSQHACCTETFFSAAVSSMDYNLRVILINKLTLPFQLDQECVSFAAAVNQGHIQVQSAFSITFRGLAVTQLL